jgi:hypothetical protein
MRRLTFLSSSAVAVALSALLACGPAPEGGNEPAPQDPQSGGLEGAPGEDPGSAPGEAGSDNSASPAHSAKVTICHIPPGNPANAHTITVGAPAVKAHIKHGDTLGACGGGGEQDAGTGGETDAGTGGGDVDAGSGGGEPDAGSGGGDVDAGPACGQVGSTCGGGVSCCAGLSCSPEGYCEPVIG